MTSPNTRGGLGAELASPWTTMLDLEREAITRADVDARRAPLAAVRPSGGLPAPVGEDRWGWRERAACRGLDPGLFHPERGPLAEAQTDAARAVCGGCVVRMTCLLVALEDPTCLGVWGGTSERQRRRMREGLPRWTVCAGCGGRMLKTAGGQRYGACCRPVVGVAS